MNRLYFGDNLKWLSDRKEFPDASVDLVYLDPPFNSNADYNVLFRERRRPRLQPPQLRGNL
jgi:site-specific DNA-methyltransferase (adenine-specific)